MVSFNRIKVGDREMKILALIPARAGSKRIPNKNILLIGGKPLICHTIDAALESKYINRVVVSTNSHKIAQIAKEAGAEIPFLRPDDISKSNSTEMDFFLHALNWMEDNEGYKPELIVLLYPTSPLRKSKTIDAAIEKMIEHPEADSLRSLKKCSEHPFKMWKAQDGYIIPFVDTPKKNAHTLAYQMLPKVYIQNASIYITKPNTIKQKQSPTGDIIVPFVMNEIESVDVNNQLDFEFAKFIIEEGIDSDMRSIH
jgi:CMP-N-acetylneuraminic acid synthetase